MMVSLLLSLVLLVASTHAFSVQQMKGRGGMTNLYMNVENVDTKKMVKVGVIGTYFIIARRSHLTRR